MNDDVDVETVSSATQTKVTAVAMAAVGRSSTQAIRILCLHGWRNSAALMSMQARGLRDALGGNAKFLFLNAPIAARGPPYESIQRVSKPDDKFYEWYYYGKIEDKEATNPNWNYEYVGVDDSLKYLEQQVAECGPFDAVMGFSQGTIMSTLLAATNLREGRQLFKLSVLVGAACPKDPKWRPLLENEDGTLRPVQIPSIHLIGKKDEFHDEALRMVDMHTSPNHTPRVFFHDEGHKFPNPKRNAKLYREVSDAILDTCKQSTE